MKYKILILIIAVIFSHAGYGDIHHASSIEEINDNIMISLAKRNAAKTLVIIPLKDFLAEAVDPAFKANDEITISAIKKAIKKMKSSTSSYIDELILTEYENKFTDTFIPKFINNIQTLNAPLIAVSPNISGSFNKIQYLEAWTWQYLFDQGVDLSKSPIGKHQIIFNKQNKKVKGSYPTFFKGLLSCNTVDNENSPQNIIISLLTYLKWMPDIVYVIDKNENYIKSIIEQFKIVRPNIQVEGYVYAPQKIANDNIDEKNLTKFWDKFVLKLNAVTRKETTKNSNPYE